MKTGFPGFFVVICAQYLKGVFYMRADLRGSPLYKPPSSQHLNLALNENFYMPWHEVLAGKIDEIAKDIPFHQYGTSSYEQLIARFANYVGVTPEEVLPASGSDSLIPYLIGALSARTVVTFDVDFFRYGQFAKFFQREHVKAPIADGIDGLIETANAHQAELILLSNPNNPLGIAWGQGALIELLEEVTCYVVIDEAYAEYHGESVVNLISKYPKLIVLRTLSKSWGLARLRVGFMLANPALIQFISAVRGPFTLSDLNARIGAHVLAHEDLMREAVQKTIQTREQFSAFLQTYQVKVYPSTANFVYVEVADARAIAARLLEDGMAVAVFGENGLRVTIGTEAQMTRLEDSLAKYLPSKK